MTRIACMFPGQGSQAIGMGKAFYESSADIRNLFREADDVLGWQLSDIMFNGPDEALTSTDVAQPALLLTSIAGYRMLQNAGAEPIMAVGHSLGEYSALVAAGALSFNDALILVHERGKLMEKAFPEGRGSMQAVLGLSLEDVRKVLDDIGENVPVDIANINCPGQIAISGSVEGLEIAGEALKKHGAKRVLPLNVSGPFHSRMMKQANEELAEKLHNIRFHDADMPVYANVTAEPVQDREEIRSLLIRQLYSPVRFHESIENMQYEGIDAFVEVGTGKVLSGLVKKIDRQQQFFTIQDPDSLAEFMTWYKEDADA